jgi:hypothetical protein
MSSELPRMSSELPRMSGRDLAVRPAIGYMCLCLCLCLCVSVSLCLCVSVSLVVSVSASVSVSVLVLVPVSTTPARQPPSPHDRVSVRMCVTRGVRMTSEVLWVCVCGGSEEFGGVRMSSDEFGVAPDERPRPRRPMPGESLGVPGELLGVPGELLGVPGGSPGSPRQNVFHVISCSSPHSSPLPSPITFRTIILLLL